MKALSKSFFKQSTLKIARQLLGRYLAVESEEGLTIGKIVETEAYLKNDEASHAFKGKTKRNAAMFESAGTVYIYFIYGSYYCFNIVTNKKGIGEAVLIRALEPLQGLDLMKKRREVDEVGKLCNGPAKLVKAMGITKDDNNLIINNSKIRLTEGKSVGSKDVIKTTRVGIIKGANEKYRFYIKGSKFISKK